MEMREIEAFLAVAEERHFRKAADRLHVTPSRVSQAVRALERRVGAPLFVRTSRTVRLTEIGADLAASLGQAVEQLRSGLAQAQRRARETAGATLRMGFANSLSDDIQTALAVGFQRERHVAAVRFNAPALDFLDMLETDRDGVFVTWFPCDPGLLALPRIEAGPAILQVPRALLVARDHPLASRELVDIEDLPGHDIVMPSGHPLLDPRYIDAWIPPVTPRGHVITRTRRTNTLEEIVEPIRSERLAHVTIRSRTTIGGNLADLVLVPLSGMEPFRLVPLWSRSRVTAEVVDFVAYAVAAGTREEWATAD